MDYTTLELIIGSGLISIVFGLVVYSVRIIGWILKKLAPFAVVLGIVAVISGVLAIGIEQSGPVFDNIIESSVDNI